MDGNDGREKEKKRIEQNRTEKKHKTVLHFKANEA